MHEDSLRTYLYHSPTVTLDLLISIGTLRLHLALWYNHESYKAIGEDRACCKYNNFCKLRKCVLMFKLSYVVPVIISISTVLQSSLKHMFDTHAHELSRSLVSFLIWYILFNFMVLNPSYVLLSHVIKSHIFKRLAFYIQWGYTKLTSEITILSKNLGSLSSIPPLLFSSVPLLTNRCMVFHNYRRWDLLFYWGFIFDSLGVWSNSFTSIIIPVLGYKITAWMTSTALGSKSSHFFHLCFWVYNLALR